MCTHRVHDFDMPSSHLNTLCRTLIVAVRLREATLFSGLRCRTVPRRKRPPRTPGPPDASLLRLPVRMSTGFPRRVRAAALQSHTAKAEESQATDPATKDAGVEPAAVSEV